MRHLAQLANEGPNATSNSDDQQGESCPFPFAAPKIYKDSGETSDADESDADNRNPFWNIPLHASTFDF
ncbi:MAG: hypothetical protein LBH08_03705 [Puniceicoccales bacterium]|nr:hypothetical protein [Puniceicoccales bacterium]